MPPGPSHRATRYERVAPGLLRRCYGVASVLLPCTSLVQPLYNRCTSLVSACALRSHYGRLNCISAHLNTKYGMAENTSPHVVVLGAGFGGLVEALLANWCNGTPRSTTGWKEEDRCATWCA